MDVGKHKNALFGKYRVGVRNRGTVGGFRQYAGLYFPGVFFIYLVFKRGRNKYVAGQFKKLRVRYRGCSRKTRYAAGSVFMLIDFGGIEPVFTPRERACLAAWKPALPNPCTAIEAFFRSSFLYPAAASMA